VSARLRRAGFSALAAGIACLTLAACADQPVQLSHSYSPMDSLGETSHPLPAGRAPCRVRLANVQDLRDDPQAAGTFSERFVHAEDAPAWLRSGLLSISRDSRLQLSDQTGAAADLEIRVDLLKLYMLTINEAKSANVVVRVHYAGQNAERDNDKVYRGAFTSVNWTGAAGEARGALDTALSKVLEDVDQDLLTRCAAAKR
jgi:hypothetical protein